MSLHIVNMQLQHSAPCNDCYDLQLNVRQQEMAMNNEESVKKQNSLKLRELKCSSEVLRWPIPCPSCDHD